MSFKIPRVARTRKHSLETILVVALLATICGADSIVDIENFGKSRKQWLETFLDMSGGVPSHDTIGRLLAALNTLMLGERGQYLEPGVVLPKLRGSWINLHEKSETEQPCNRSW